MSSATNYFVKIPFKTISATKNTTSLSVCLTNISHSCSTSKMMSSGVGASARNRFPFTTTQWQELEHQALIFKYIISKMPPALSSICLPFLLLAGFIAIAAEAQVPANQTFKFINHPAAVRKKLTGAV
jgi:hypothetical protein